MTLNHPRFRSQDFLIKHLEQEDRYNVGLKRGQIGNHQWAFDWPYLLLSWMTLNWPTRRWSKLHIECSENGDRYNDCVNGS